MGDKLKCDSYVVGGVYLCCWHDLAPLFISLMGHSSLGGSGLFQNNPTPIHKGCLDSLMKMNRT